MQQRQEINQEKETTKKIRYDIEMVTNSMRKERTILDEAMRGRIDLYKNYCGQLEN